MDEIFDIVMQCSNELVHPPHQWMDIDNFPNGYRCFGVHARNEQERPTWPPRMETKAEKTSARAAR